MESVHNKETINKIIRKLSEETGKCKSLDDYVDLAYSFRFDDFSIIPLQIQNEIKTLLEILSKNKIESMLEIGTANGGTLFLLSKITSKDGNIISVDLPEGKFGGDLYPNWKMPIYESFAQYNQKIHLIRADSHEENTLVKAKNALKGKKLDLLFIDGDHSYEGVKKDFEMYSPFVRDGGIIAFHDISPGAEYLGSQVTKFWKKISPNHKSIEISFNMGNDGYGIGLLFFKSSKEDLTEYGNALEIANIQREQLIAKLREDLDKYQSKINDPLDLLLSIYFRRPDLQAIFPEVFKREYENLLNWAVNTDLSKIGNEQDTNIVTKYRKIYQEELEKLTKEKMRLAKLTTEKQEQEAQLAKLTTEKQEQEAQLAKLTTEKQEQEAQLAKLTTEKQEQEAQLEKIIGEKQKQKILYEKTLLEKTELEDNLRIAHEAVKQREQERQVIVNELSNIKGSISWKIIQKIQRWLAKNFPSGSKRGNLLQLVLQFIRYSNAHGFISASKMAASFLKKSKLQSLDVNVQPKSQLISWKELQNFDNKQIQKMRANAQSFKFKPTISIIMPVYNVDEKWLRLAIDSVVRQIYENWELCIADDASTKPHIKQILSEYARKDSRIKTKFLEKNQNISGASNEALLLVTGEYVGLLDHDDEIYPDALYELIKAINNNKNLEIIYSDENHISSNGERVDPFFKPDYSPDLLMTCHYMVHFIVYKTSLLHELGGFRRGFDGSQDYDLVLRAVEKTNQIYHIPKPLYGWRNIPTSTASGINAKPYAQIAAKKALEEALKRRKIDGTPELIPELGYFKINYNLSKKPLVSIIITSRDRPDLLSRLLSSIETKTTYNNYEIIVVDHLSEKKETLDFLKSLKHKVIRYEKEFNISNLFNFAEKYANGEYLLTMNDDLEVITENWIESMLSPCQREEVAIVGAQLIYPDASAQEGLVRGQTIQHAGVVLGVGGIAGHAFRHVNHNDNGYFALNKALRNYSAVTGACMLVKRHVYKQVNGYDPTLKVAYNDVDFCLRVRKEGYLVVCTPYAKLYHYEGASRGIRQPSDDAKIFVNRWKDVLIKRDPYYNVNLTLLREDFGLSFCGIPIDETPLALLMEIYAVRPDLQKSFPEAATDYYENLINWAKTYGSSGPKYGLPHDAYSNILSLYQFWYEENSGMKRKVMEQKVT